MKDYNIYSVLSDLKKLDDFNQSSIDSKFDKLYEEKLNLKDQYDSIYSEYLKLKKNAVNMPTKEVEDTCNLLISNINKIVSGFNNPNNFYKDDYAKLITLIKRVKSERIERDDAIDIYASRFEGQNELYYFRKNFNTLYNILDDGLILATKEDYRDKSLTNFISLTSDINVIPQRRPTKYVAGIVIDTNKLARVLAKQDYVISVRPKFDWASKHSGTIAIASIGCTTEPIYYTTGEGDSELVVKHTDKKYYIKPHNCGTVYIDQAHFNQIQKEIASILGARGLPWNYGKLTSEGKTEYDDDNYYQEYVHGKFIGADVAPKLGELSPELQKYITERTIFNEHEARLDHINEKLNVKEAISGIIVNDTLRQFFDGKNKDVDLTQYKTKAALEKKFGKINLPGTDNQYSGFIKVWSYYKEHPELEVKSYRLLADVNLKESLNLKYWNKFDKEFNANKVIIYEDLIIFK